MTVPTRAFVRGRTGRSESRPRGTRQAAPPRTPPARVPARWRAVPDTGRTPARSRGGRRGCRCRRRGGRSGGRGRLRRSTRRTHPAIGQESRRRPTHESRSGRVDGRRSPPRRRRGSGRQARERRRESLPVPVMWAHTQRPVPDPDRGDTRNHEDADGPKRDRGHQHVSAASSVMPALGSEPRGSGHWYVAWANEIDGASECSRPPAGCQSQHIDVAGNFRLSSVDDRSRRWRRVRFMIRSMTGFGRAEAVGDTVAVTVEIRSVNHRHLDVALRLPSTLAMLELDARRLVQARLERGRVDVGVQLTPTGGQPAQDVRANESLARRYAEQARHLGRELGLTGEPSLAWLLERPGVLEIADVTPPSPTAVWPLLERALAAALDGLVTRRAAEGAALASELRGLLNDLGAEVNAMAARAPLAAARRGERLRERLHALLGEVPLDEARILTEVAVWAQKTDVTEELARLRTHVDEFTLMLDKGGPVGRQLDFLIQELNREVNTVAAKADDLELSQATLAAKGIIEKMREQVQNLE